jgi:predicted RNase H-like HicB family nuclease
LGKRPDVDINIELTDSSGYIEAVCPELGLVARASSLEETLQRISRLVVYVTSSLDEMPLTIGESQEAHERLTGRSADRNFCLPRHPKVH